jgi:hypothetical protein
LQPFGRSLELSPERPNNHVLGVEVCPADGCSAQITFLHQHRATSRQQMVFVPPRAVDVELGVAIVQVYGANGGAELATAGLRRSTTREDRRARHRGPTSEDLFTDDGENEYAVGTASAPIWMAMSASL